VTGRTTTGAVHKERPAGDVRAAGNEMTGRYRGGDNGHRDHYRNHTETSVGQKPTEVNQKSTKISFFSSALS
jgi:hypothetical protein